MTAAGEPDYQELPLTSGPEAEQLAELDIVGTVYLIHFETPYEHAQHYLGWTEDLESRLERHRAGRGSPLLAAVNRAGIEWRVVRTWPEETRRFERFLKLRSHTRKLCPVCDWDGGRRAEFPPALYMPR